MKVTVDRITSSPELTGDVRAAINRALEILASWLEASGLDSANIDVASLDLDLPIGMRGATAPNGPAFIAEAIAVKLRSKLETNPTQQAVVVEAGGLTGGPGQLVETIRTAGRKDLLGYYDGELARKIGALKKQAAPKDLGPKVAERSFSEHDLSVSWRQLQGALEQAQNEYLRRSRGKERKEKDKEAQKLAEELSPLVVAHLAKGGVHAKVDKDKAFVVILPENGGSRLNKVALGLKLNQGVDLKVDCKGKITEPRIMGYYQWRDKSLVLDFEEGVAQGKVGDTILHEVVHSYQDALRQAGLDPTTTLELTGKLPVMQRQYQNRFGKGYTHLESLGHHYREVHDWQTFYNAYMSTEELLTFSRQFTWTTMKELRGEEPRLFTYDLLQTIRSETKNLKAICANVLGVAESALPHMRQVASTGDDGKELKVESKEELGRKAEVGQLGEKTHSWKVTAHATSQGKADLKVIDDGKGVLKRLFASNKKRQEIREARKRVAQRMVEKLEILELAAKLVYSLASTVEAEAATLKPGKDVLTSNGVRTLRGLIAWPGYIARLANAPELTAAERLASVQDQQHRLQAIIGTIKTP